MNQHRIERSDKTPFVIGGLAILIIVGSVAFAVVCDDIHVLRVTVRSQSEELVEYRNEIDRLLAVNVIMTEERDLAFAEVRQLADSLAECRNALAAVPEPIFDVPPPMPFEVPFVPVEKPVDKTPVVIPKKPAVCGCGCCKVDCKCVCRGARK